MEVIGNEAEVDRSTAKIAIVAILGAALAGAFSYAANRMIGGDSSMSLVSIIFAFLFLSVYVLQPILIKSQSKNYVIVLGEALAMTVWFYALLPVYIFSAFAALVIFLGLGVRHETIEIRDRLRIRVAKIVRGGIKSGLSALSAFLVIVYMGGLSEGGEVLSKNAFQKLIAPTVPLVQAIYPGLTLTDSFEVVAKNIIEQEIRSAPEAALLSPSQFSAFVSEGVRSLRLQFAEFLGITFDARDTVLDILYSWFTAKFAALPSASQTWILMGVGILGFLAIRGTGFLLTYPLELFAALLFKLLLLSGFAARFSENRSREFVVLK